MSWTTKQIALDPTESLGGPRESVVADIHSIPSVSVVIPCLNEELFIGQLLRSLKRQYQRGRFELIVVDGMSADRTREVIAEFAASDPDVPIRVLDNPARHIPTALNLGIREAQGEIIVRMDAHSIPSAAYVRRCVELLTERDAAVVGMPWHIRAGNDSAMARAIALAVAHPFGIGDAKYRLKNSTAEFVDTVPFGVFRKSLWEKLGGFNEDLLANEDYDFNYRVRKGGGRVLLDTTEHCDYVARPTLRELTRQYWRYGRWKAQMIKSQPRSMRWRHLVAPAFVTSLVLTSVISFLWKPAAWLFLPAGSYAVLAFICTLQLALRNKEIGLLFMLPPIFLAIHLAWGSSFLFGLLKRGIRH